MEEKKILLTDLIKEVSDKALFLDRLDEFIEWVMSKTSFIVDSVVSVLVVRYPNKNRLYIKIEQPVDEIYLDRVTKDTLDALRNLSQDLQASYSEKILYGEDKIISQESRSENLPYAFHCAPFVVKNNILGGFSIATNKQAEILPYKINMFNSFVNQVALGIESIKAKEEVVKQARLIEENRAKMAAVLSSMHEGLIMVDNNNRIVFSNPAAQNMLHIEEATQEIPGEFSPTFLSLLEKLHKENRKMVSKEVKTQDDRILQVEISPALGTQGEVIGSVVLLRDITRLKEIERMKSEFISTVSHELRTPLATIKEAISQVLEGLLGETTEAQREFLTICLEDIERLTRIINGLLDISKIEANRLRIRKENIDIVKLVKGVVNSFTPRFKEKGLEAKTEFSHEYLEVYCDRDKIIQVFTNLIGNAIKFTEKGYIKIRVEKKDGYVECMVEDTGKGIAEENLPRVFDKFMQFGREYGPGEKGTGLGLAITKGIVELHRGRIWVESKLGKGTKFFFTLPEYRAEEEKFYEEVKSVMSEEGYSQERLIFIARIDKKEEISKVQIKEIAKTLQDILERQRRRDVVVTKDDKHIIIISYGGKEEVNQKRHELKKLLKEVILEKSAETDLEFSYGCFVLASDDEDIQETLDNFCASLISEKEERLRKKIMVVDDDEEVVNFVRSALNNMGYTNVIQAYNGDEALGYLEKELVDLIILDMKMPKMSGYEVIGRLKEDNRTKDISILIMSGYKVEYERLNEYVKKKAIPIIGKPLNIKELKKLVDYLL